MLKLWMVQKDQQANNQTSGNQVKANDIITLEAYFMGRRQTNFSEYKPEYADNATDLLSRVNPFLQELDIVSVKVSSGWRPASINESLSNSAKQSYHMIGKAVDISDADGKLDALVQARPDLLKKYGLWLESPASTPGWCHLDCGSRLERTSRTFIP